MSTPFTSGTPQVLRDRPTTMRAALLPGAGQPAIVGEAPVPVRVNDEVLIRVVAAGVNPIDMKTAKGGGGAPAISAWPAVPGRDFSGVVVESPYGASSLQPGDEVYGMTSFPRAPGSFAEYVAVPTTQVARKPKVLSHVEAAAVPLAALTAWGAVVDVGKAHEGQRMLIHAGAGGVGHFAVQFAAYFGAHVITTCSARNVSWLRELGAAEVIDYSSVPFEDLLADVDVVIDLIGNVTADTGSRSLPTLRPGGLYLNLPSDSWTGFEAAAAAAGLRASGYKVSADGATLAIISRLLESGDIKVYVDEVFDLSDIGQAYAKLEGGHTRGKLVLLVHEG